ncbi:hypothetical protein [Alloalcanivorax xenomutans]|uniref:hypothetical protein n=1 Tax=Alloalcanivorax xenomutans TaxID=1094342 RepID=UPI003BAAFEE5
MRLLLMTFLFLSTYGCASHYSVEPALPPSSTPVFAPVTAYIDDGTQGSGNAYPYDVEIYKILVASGMFSSLSSLGPENQLIINFDTHNNEGLAAVFVSAALLFLLPIKHDFDYTLVAEARVHGTTVRQYHYRVNEQAFKAPLLDPGMRSSREAIAILMSHFLKDLADQPPFPEMSSPMPSNQTPITL